MWEGRLSLPLKDKTKFGIMYFQNYWRPSAYCTEVAFC